MSGRLYPRPTADGLRRVSFRSSWRHGVHEGQVRALLGRLADELELLHREIATVRDENLRLKTALRDWQSRIGSTRR